VGNGDGVPDADVVGEHPLEACVEGVVILTPCRARGVGDEFDFAVGDRRRRDGNALRSDDHASTQNCGVVEFADISFVQVPVLAADAIGLPKAFA
jgi:hypothetical protein